MAGNDAVKRTTGQAVAGSALLFALLTLLGDRLGQLDAANDPQSKDVRAQSIKVESLSSAPGRGRSATAPSKFGWPAWRDVFVRTFQEASADEITTVSGGITFFGLLALFPSVAALVSLYALVADPTTIRDHLADLSFILPPNAFSIVADQVQRILEQGGTELSFKFALSLGVSLWSANAGMKAMISGLNVAYEEEEKRSFLAVNIQSLALTIAALLALLCLVALTVVLPQLFPSGSAQAGATLLRWPAMLFLLMMGLTVLYRFGPSRFEPQWRWVTWGSALAALSIVAISVLLAWYLTNFADYNKTYGSLGALVGLLTWMWLSATAVLLGAELNAEMEHQTARDTTVGMPKPIGLRGARMADTIGRSAK